MNIRDMKQEHTKPFEIDDDKLRRLFSFFVHSAPTIESSTAAVISEERLVDNWNRVISSNMFSNFKIYADSYSLSEDSLDKNGLGISQEVSRKIKAIVCKRKCKDEKDYECVLRHIRNSLAHNNVYVVNAGNRKYILLEDYNTRMNLTSRMVLSQTILSNLKSEIMK